MSNFSHSDNNIALNGILETLQHILQRLERIERHLMPPMEIVSTPVMTDVVMEDVVEETFEAAPVRELPQYINTL